LVWSQVLRKGRMVMLFYITFPVTSPFADYWVEIDAQREEDARAWAQEELGLNFDFCYTPERFRPQYFPKGCLKRIDLL
jgi:hypothetical protein